MKFHEETQMALLRKLDGWTANHPGIYTSPSGRIRLQLSRSTGETRIFLLNSDHESSGYTRLENWKANWWSAVQFDDATTLRRLYREALARIEDFQTAAQVAIILSELGVLPKENTLSAPVDANTSHGTHNP